MNLVDAEPVHVSAEELAGKIREFAPSWDNPGGGNPGLIRDITVVKLDRPRTFAVFYRGRCGRLRRRNVTIGDVNLSAWAASFIASVQRNG